VREALSRDHRSIGTEHILLALVREHEGVAAIVLRELGGDAEAVRGAVDGVPPGPA
jgi:ATP-dependent Clp protease ATP-binding subunit ClpC